MTRDVYCKYFVLLVRSMQAHKADCQKSYGFENHLKCVGSYGEQMYLICKHFTYYSFS